MNFPSQIFFKDINHGYRAAILKKILCVSFHFIWCGYLLPIMKRCAERLYQIVNLLKLYLNVLRFFARLSVSGVLLHMVGPM